MSSFIKCKFCSWNTLRYRTLRDGQVKTSTGWRLLEDHIFLAHPEEWDKIQKKLSEELDMLEMEDNRDEFLR